MRIAHFGLRALSDPSQHAQNMRMLLEGLADRGHDILSVATTAFSFVPEHDVARAAKRLGFETSSDRLELSRQQKTHREVLLRIDGMRNPRAVIARANDLGAAFGPDLLIVSAEAGVLNELLRNVATDAPIILAGESWDRADGHDKPELVFVTGRDCDDTHQNRLELPPLLEKVSNSNETRPYVTFVEPTWENGAALFFQAIHHLSEVLPTQKFLVVQREGQMEQLESETGLPLSQVRRLDVLQHPWFDFNYLDATRVLVVPAMTSGTDLRVTLEALARGIPVLGSSVPPLGDLLAPTGATLDLSQHRLSNPHLPATSADVMPWTLALATLLTDDDFYSTQSAFARDIAAAMGSGDPIDGTEAWLKAHLEAAL